MNRIVLLYVDQKQRDFVGIYLIKHFLNKRRVKVVLASNVDFLLKYALFKPNVILQAHPDSYHGNYTRLMSCFSFVLSLPTELMIEDDLHRVLRVVDGHNPANPNFRPPFWEGISKIFVYSNAQFESFAEYPFLQEKMCITGCPKVVSKNIKKLKETKLNKRDIVIGIAFEEMYNYQNISEFLHLLMDYKFTEFGGSVDNCVSFFIKIHFLQLKLIRLLSRKKNHTILVRHRLGDAKNNYQYLEEIYDNVKRHDNCSVINFFDSVDCVVACQSSILTEAQMFGLPAISVSKLIEGFDDHLNLGQHSSRVSLSWQPNDLKELLEILNKLAMDNLDIGPDLKKIDLFTQNTYGIKVNEKVKKTHPAENIANEIMEYLDKKKKGCESDTDYYFKIKDCLGKKIRHKVLARIVKWRIQSNSYLSKLVILSLLKMLYFKIKFYKIRNKDEFELYYDNDNNSISVGEEALAVYYEKNREA